jgi:hypothetical protein
LYTVTTSRFTKAKSHGIAKPLLDLKRKFVLGVISKSHLDSVGSVEFIA